MAYAHSDTSHMRDAEWDSRPSISHSGRPEHDGHTAPAHARGGAKTDEGRRAPHPEPRIDYDDPDSFKVHERHAASRGFRGHEKIDVTRATVARPAHPLPAVRRGSVDLNQYLQPQTDHFMIFTAPERRRKRNSITLGILIALFVLLGVLFVILYQPA